MGENERRAWVQLALTPYIGPESFLQLLQHFGSAQAALAASAEQIRNIVRHKQAASAWADTEKRRLAEQAAEAALAWEMRDGCRLLLLHDSDFPLMLAEGITPPPLLFARGQTEYLSRPAVAVVGSRHATPQALRIAQEFGAALSGQGITVVSGMAAGIDTAAHQGALRHNGGTVAVWGTGIDRVYPAANRRLAHEIAEKGLILSEFPLDTRPLAGNFPRRNRLIAALSHATLVVEAAPASGSLITAALAAEMGREVMAVPGSIDNPHSKGCHQLIKSGAKLVECLDDILQECPALLQNPLSSAYSVMPTKKTPDAKPPQAATAGFQTASPNVHETVAAVAPVMPSENQALLAAMGYDPVHPDTLADQLAWPAEEIYARLLELELEGTVAAAAGGRYQRVA
ncbi:DNA-processing protein DprA [Neisseria sp. ZJ106]|uniref:DNA-processing protein DprA n=1 Tax=Neisseria lisongii TaxID=2912188 RepID=A0ABY7RJI8_9NEIS|nr:DNA-processing protein DprA [Neisseria lisongii]MCF7522087.1 DNA-processing protein DprA [Neisseria lisongii]WCL71373.1 DNA-processing protein DprA [Neisseria lisongii]